VVLIHGLGGYVENWLSSFNALAAQHRVYALDLPGHGRTDKLMDISYRIADLAQFVEDFMAVLKIEHAHVVGHSLGGAVSTRLVLVHPAVVDKLILVASGGLGKEVGSMLRIASIPLLGDLLTRPSLSGSAQSAKILVYDPAVMTNELIKENFQMASLPGAQQAFLKTLRANGSLFGQVKSNYGPNVYGLPSIKKPVLVIWGQQDQVVPVAHADVAAKNIPNVRMHLLDKCGHAPMLEHPQVFNELLLEFLRD
jgi:4,5:9,10-diseco-3-hydroxy-5,9,17-trioxoandrosta-1(10),2-diene-4-oate hydrolase